MAGENVTEVLIVDGDPIDPATATETISFYDEVGTPIDLSEGSGDILVPNLDAAVGSTVPPNSFTTIVSAGNGIIYLPSNPKAGTKCYFQQKRTTNNGNNIITPQGGATIEGSSGCYISCNVTATGRKMGLQYDGTNWWIIMLDPNPFEVLLGCGGGAAGDTPFAGQYHPLSRSSRFNSFAITSGIPFQFVAGFSNLDFLLTTPRYTGGSITCQSVTLSFSQAPDGATPAPNRLVLTCNPGLLEPNKTYNPGILPFPELHLWTVAESAGSDLAIWPDGASMSSTAGYQYWWSFTAILITNNLVP